MAPKIHVMVSSCGSCPSNVGGNCIKTDEAVRNRERIAAFCPLTDFPSRLLARMEMTISALQGQYMNNPIMYLFTAICARHKLLLSEDGAVIMKVKKPEKGEPEEIRMGFQDIIEHDIQLSRFKFTFQGVEYLLDYGGDKIQLRRQVKEDSLPGKILYCDVYLE